MKQSFARLRRNQRLLLILPTATVIVRLIHALLTQRVVPVKGSNVLVLAKHAFEVSGLLKLQRLQLRLVLDGPWNTSRGHHFHFFALVSPFLQTLLYLLVTLDLLSQV